ncbi:procollagen, type VI, alpha 3 [Sinorhizobium sojae CCBAU 05684]|uniref:Procollagen, type VI, alpha 3 n=1 Tax=Sinorhizobium sojae CCBAU 05684 TaxID=716928 RepID=A0A249PD11_9HYPH|nr:flagellar biosynthetic protein FliO [Sinorhizobium sojae]ASY63149.1 procollagen, type VI, alpha 3 [Sinorhizobium sojae CCBAU 05684]
MLETIVGDNGSRFIIAAGAVAIGLLCLVAVLWIIRRKPSSPFVRGGRNRQPRLAVLDAAAVDTRRRLVLVRRDDVEHLIMIGGPTDIVIESRIVADDTAPGTAPSDESHIPVATAKPEEKPQKVEEETRAAEPMRTMRVDETVRPSVRTEPAPPLVAAAAPRPAPAARPEEQPFTRFQSAAPAIAPVSAVEPRQESSTVPGDRVLPMARAAEGTRPTQQSAPAEPRQPQPVAVRPATTEKTVDFERMLDAEISSDLQRLAPAGAARQPSRPAASVRQEPMLGVTPPEASRETTIDEEMTRMLADISAGRKP